MKKGLWLNRGLSFRFGHQRSVEVGKSWTVRNQKLAFESQIQLIEHLEKKHECEIDIIIDTFTTQYDNIIKDLFKNKAIEFNFIKTLDRETVSAFNRAVYRITPKLVNYDFFIISRNDVYFKKSIFDLINTNEEEIKYTFDLSHDLVGDLFFFIPKIYFDAIELFKLCLWDHHGYKQFVNKNYPDCVISPYILSQHDSDSAKCWNPLYKIVGRPEKDEESSKNWVLS